MCPASQDRPTPLDRKEHNEKDTNNRSQLQSSCLAARTEAVAMASCLKVNSNIPNEHQSIKTARGTYERIIMRASFMEVTLHNKREKRIRLYFFAGKHRSTIEAIRCTIWRRKQLWWSISRLMMISTATSGRWWCVTKGSSCGFAWWDKVSRT